MTDIQMGVVESRFADMIWEREPITAAELAKLSEQTLKWKKTTSYTVLKRLCEKGIFKNENGKVTSVISRERFYSLQSEKFVDDTFEGSLPAFLAAFTSGKRLTEKEVEYLRRMVAEYDEKER